MEANYGGAEPLIKRPRLDLGAEAESSEILVSLRQSIQNVISSVAAQIELPAEEFQPTASAHWQPSSSSSSLPPDENRDKIKRQIEWLNGVGGFQNRIHCQKILEIASSCDTWFVLNVLKDLQGKMHEVLDPTSFVITVLRGSAGNSSPFLGALNPTMGSTTALQSHTLPGAPGLTALANATMSGSLPALAFGAHPASTTVTAMPFSSPVAGSSCNGNPASPLGSGARSCIPPSIAAMVKKKKIDNTEDAAEGLGQGQAILPSPANQLHMPDVSLWQQQVGQPDAMAQKLMATVASIPMAQSTLTLPPKIAEEHPMAAQVFMLAQHAEESAQTAASSEAICKSLQDPSHQQVEVLAQTASQSAQKASWAVNFMDSYFPSVPGTGESADWFRNMKGVVKKASEVADNAAHTCRCMFKDLKSRVPELTEDGRRTKVSPVPCKWFVTSVCRNGENCDYSHDPAIFDARPLDKKRAVECTYFQKGQCSRGAGCPFAHGAEELAEINKVVHTLRTEKRLPILTKRMMDIQKGKMPFTYSST